MLAQWGYSTITWSLLSRCLHLKIFDLFMESPASTSPKLHAPVMSLAFPWPYTESLRHLFSSLLTYLRLSGSQLYSQGQLRVTQLAVPAPRRLGGHGIRVDGEGQGCPFLSHLSLELHLQTGSNPLGTLLLLTLIFPLCHLILEGFLILKLVKTSKQRHLLMIWLERDSYPLAYSYCCLIQGHGVLAAPRWADRQDYSLDLPRISLLILY